MNLHHQLQEQIKKNKAEQKNLKKELASYEEKAKALKIKLEDLDTADVLFKKIQRKLKHENSQRSTLKWASNQVIADDDQDIDNPIVGHCCVVSFFY
jgi:hypothetical protein